MVKPASLYQAKPGNKRTAVPSDWGSGYDNLLRAPQGFRFHSGGQDYMARDLLFKRAKEEETKKEKKSEDRAPKTKKDAEPSIPSTTEVEPQESAAEASFEPFNNNLWLENFESLMADASLP